MKHYIIDGNNLLHKIKSLKTILSKDKQSPRERLAFMVERFSFGKNIKVSLHYDGFERMPIRTSNTKIYYSDKKAADEDIRNEIESSKNRRNLIVVTSDDALREFARKCGCVSLLSEDFAVMLKPKDDSDDEKKRIESIGNNEYFKNIFK